MSVEDILKMVDRGTISTGFYGLCSRYGRNVISQ